MANIIRNTFTTPSELMRCIKKSGPFKYAIQCTCDDTVAMKNEEWILSDSLLAIINEFYSYVDFKNMKFVYEYPSQEDINDYGEQVVGDWVLKSNANEFPWEELPWSQCGSDTPTPDLTPEEVAVEFYSSFLQDLNNGVEFFAYYPDGLCRYFYEQPNFKEFIFDWDTDISKSLTNSTTKKKSLNTVFFVDFRSKS